MDYINYIIIGLLILILIFLILLVFKSKNKEDNFEYKMLRDKISDLNTKLENYQNNISVLKQDINVLINKEFKDSFTNLNKNINDNFNSNIINTTKILNERLDKLIDYNNKKLDEINKNVNEKLEKSINTKLEESFKNIFENMNIINKGIGEIKHLASDVSSLNNVLTNVKTKGIIGEVLLDNIISETLTKDLYEINFKPFDNKRDVVEFAIKIKSLDDSVIYLPIDSKFPLVYYNQIVEAIDSCDKLKLIEARKNLGNEIRKFARDISEKYINYPYTTNYAIMFLPIEGLYSEVINSNIFNEVRTKYNIIIASPSTLTALLNSLMLGFKTITIAKKSEEVFRVLTKVKEEFVKFEDALNDSIKNLELTKRKLDDVVGVRTRQLIKQLDKIELNDNLIESSEENDKF